MVIYRMVSSVILRGDRWNLLKQSITVYAVPFFYFNDIFATCLQILASRCTCLLSLYFAKNIRRLEGDNQQSTIAKLRLLK